MQNVISQELRYEKRCRRRKIRCSSGNAAIRTWWVQALMIPPHECRLISRIRLRNWTVIVIANGSWGNRYIREKVWGQWRIGCYSSGERHRMKTTSDRWELYCQWCIWQTIHIRVCGLVEHGPVSRHSSCAKQHWMRCGTRSNRLVCSWNRKVRMFSISVSQGDWS